MSLVPLCSVDDVTSIISDFAVNANVDDNRTGELSTDERQFLADAIEQATSRIQFALAQWYNLSTLPGNTWLKWCCAVISAVRLFRRRGDTAPDGLINTYNEYVTDLQAVQDNKAIIPSDNGSDAQLLSQNAGIQMSNLRIDSRYAIRKVRVVPRSSIGDQRSKFGRPVDYVSTYFLE